MQIISFFVNLWSHSSDYAPSHLRGCSESPPRMVREWSEDGPSQLRYTSDYGPTQILLKMVIKKQNGVTINRSFLRLIFNINLEFCLN
jgi:hypothetical protein